MITYNVKATTLNYIHCISNALKINELSFIHLFRIKVIFSDILAYFYAIDTFIKIRCAVT